MFHKLKISRNSYAFINDDNNTYIKYWNVVHADQRTPNHNTDERFWCGTFYHCKQWNMLDFRNNSQFVCCVISKSTLFHSQMANCFRIFFLSLGSTSHILLTPKLVQGMCMPGALLHTFIWIVFLICATWRPKSTNEKSLKTRACAMYMVLLCISIDWIHLICVEFLLFFFAPFFFVLDCRRETIPADWEIES